MKKVLSYLITLTVMAALLAPTTGCGRKVTVTTGEMVLCTAGEIIEDNTEQLEVPEGDAADYSVTTKVITCERHSDLATLYALAQKAIAEGDLVTARERLQTIVERDPTYGKAADQLATIDAGTAPLADTEKPPAAEPGSETTPGTTPGTTPAEPFGPVANLTQFVPDSIPGYVAQGIIADEGSLSRQYLPTGSNADQLVIAVDQQVSADAAAAAAEAITASYPDNAGTKTVGGKRVTVGTRERFAVAAFSDGAVLVVIELHATGSSGAGLIDACLAVADAILP